MFSLRIVWSVFPLKIFMGGSISPSDVTDNSTVRRFFPLPEEQTRNFFSLFFKIQFNETVSKNAGVSSISSTGEKGYFGTLINLVIYICLTFDSNTF